MSNYRTLSSLPTKCSGKRIDCDGTLGTPNWLSVNNVTSSWVPCIDDIITPDSSTNTSPCNTTCSQLQNCCICQNGWIYNAAPIYGTPGWRCKDKCPNWAGSYGICPVDPNKPIGAQISQADSGTCYKKIDNCTPDAKDKLIGSNGKICSGNGSPVNNAADNACVCQCNANVRGTLCDDVVGSCDVTCEVSPNFPACIGFSPVTNNCGPNYNPKLDGTCTGSGLDCYGDCNCVPK